MASATLPDVQLDAGGLDELTVGECWQQLATQRVGRVAVNGGCPAIPDAICARLKRARRQGMVT